jgi:hypothetical protein
LYQNRLNDYRRDVGFSKVLLDNAVGVGWKFQRTCYRLEIFNLFNNQNAITNTWVRDAYSKMNMRFKLYDDTCFNVERQVVKSSAITFRQASVLLLKVSINVRTILKFITFEFILAHHYETFIYSLELHCFTASCKRGKEAKVIYDTINKEKKNI